MSYFSEISGRQYYSSIVNSGNVIYFSENDNTELTGKWNISGENTDITADTPIQYSPIGNNWGLSRISSYVDYIVELKSDELNNSYTSGFLGKYYELIRKTDNKSIIYTDGNEHYLSYNENLSAWILSYDKFGESNIYQDIFFTNNIREPSGEYSNFYKITPFSYYTGILTNKLYIHRKNKNKVIFPLKININSEELISNPIYIEGIKPTKDIYNLSSNWYNTFINGLTLSGFYDENEKYITVISGIPTELTAAYSSGIVEIINNKVSGDDFIETEVSSIFNIGLIKVIPNTIFYLNNEIITNIGVLTGTLSSEQTYNIPVSAYQVPMSGNTIYISSDVGSKDFKPGFFTFETPSGVGTAYSNTIITSYYIDNANTTYKLSLKYNHDYYEYDTIKINGILNEDLSVDLRSYIPNVNFKDESDIISGLNLTNNIISGTPKEEIKEFSKYIFINDNNNEKIIGKTKLVIKISSHERYPINLIVCGPLSEITSSNFYIKKL